MDTIEQPTNTKTNTNPIHQKTDAFTFFGKMLTFSRLHLQSNDLEQITAQLEQTIDNKNSQIPVVIDSDVPQDLSALVALLWQWGLQPIGVIGGDLTAQAKELRLAIFPDDGKRIARLEIQAKTQRQNQSHTPPEIPEKSHTTAESLHHHTQANEMTNEHEVLNQTQNELSNQATNTDSQDESHHWSTMPCSHVSNQVKVITQILRSGQRIEHLGGDLIITNSINDGAEAITDSNLHVYGRGLGRLVAGATGDKNAKIFCQNFNPSLVSVAGTWQLRDDIPKEYLDKAVQVSYQEGHGIVYTLMDNTLVNTI